MTICLSKNIIHIVLYIDMKVHRWNSKFTKKKITRLKSSDVKHTFLYIRLNRYDDCFLLKNIILIILYIVMKVHRLCIESQKKKISK